MGSPNKVFERMLLLVAYISLAYFDLPLRGKVELILSGIKDKLAIDYGGRHAFIVAVPST